MRFEWDERKNRKNIRKHGFDFTDAWEVFESPVLERVDDRQNYGDERWVAIGRLREVTVVIVYTQPDDQSMRIISLRKADQDEQEIYFQRLQDELGQG
jgi:uncharacterized protein